jgi:hypothetical protein
MSIFLKNQAKKVEGQGKNLLPKNHRDFTQAGG